MVTPARILLVTADCALIGRVQHTLAEAGLTQIEVASGPGFPPTSISTMSCCWIMQLQTLTESNCSRAFRWMLRPGHRVILVGAGQEAVVEQAVEAGAADWVVKDDQGLYLALLPAVLKRAASRQQAAEERDRLLTVIQESAESSVGWRDRVEDAVLIPNPSGRNPGPFSPRLLFTAVEQSPGVITITDTQGAIVYVNPKFVEVTGYTAEEVIGKNPRILKSGQQPYSFYRRLWKTIVAGHEWRGDFCNRKKDGSLYWESASVSAVLDEQGEITHYIKAAEDVSERKELEEVLKRRTRELSLLNRAGRALGSSLDLDQVLMSVLDELNQLSNSVASSVWLVEPDTGDLVCRQSKGPSREIVRGWRLAAGEGIVGSVAQTGTSLIVQDAPADERYSSTLGDRIGLDLHSILSVPLQVKRGVIGVLQVVDEQVGRFDQGDLELVEPLAASAAIAIENAQLYERAQQEIAERRRAEEALRQRSQELQARNEELDAYAHTVAHDLKNPLAMILGYSAVMREEVIATGGGRSQRYLDQMLKSGSKMQNIIDELLLLAGVRSAEVEIASLDMSSLVAAALERLCYMLDEHQAEVILPEVDWPPVLGYAPWIEEVWVNYLSNAVKYGGRPPRIEIGASASDEPGMVLFWVRDDGGGLTPEQQTQLFVPFARLDQARASGHGLGLSIVRRIVEKLGGRVGVQSEPGKGSVFSFSLPGAD